VKHWELIADKLSASGWSWGCVSAIDSKGRTLWIVDAHRDNGKRFVVRSEEKLTAFLELESGHNALPPERRFILFYLPSENVCSAWRSNAATGAPGRGS
jgi:hypothetical protein